jgi:phospholipase C
MNVHRAGAMVCLIAVMGLAGCSGSSGTPNSSAVLPQKVAVQNEHKGRRPHDVVCAQTITTCINHVVIIVQENRTFDNFFKDYPGANTQDYGLSNCSGLPSQITLTPIDLKDYRDPNHDWGPSHQAYDGGKMDGFCHNPDVSGTVPYSYVPQGTGPLGGNGVQPLWYYAEHYVIADHMYPTEFGKSFTAHLNLIAGNDELVAGNNAEVDAPTGEPWGCDAPTGTTTEYFNSSTGYHSGGPFPCFDQFRTMKDVLDAAGITWKYYAPCVSSSQPHPNCSPTGDAGGLIWSEFDAIKNVRYGTDWSTHVISPQTTVVQDAQNDRPDQFPQVAWVIPDEADSDHAGSGSDTGPSWVKSVVHAIRTNPYGLWHSTAIIVVWDDWGGWYDNVPPPQLDFRGLGIRVPCLIISPFTYNMAAEGKNVSHTRYEFGSILKFVEQVFDLPTIGTQADGYTDGRANSLGDAFDFTLDPNGGAIDPTTPYDATYFLSRPATGKAPDK